MTYVYAKSLEDLQVKSVGRYHDHIQDYYFGLTKDAPKRFNANRSSGKYCFIYKD